MDVALKPLHMLKVSLARQYVKLYPRRNFIGVSGSLGKTTCVRAASSILSLKFNTISTKANLNSILNIPSTILRLSPAVLKVLLEMGIENVGEMDFLLNLIRPKTVVITKIDHAHIEGLGNLEEVFEEYKKLIAQLDSDGVAILNYDDPLCRKLAENCKGKIVYFGTDSQNCDIWAGNLRVEDFKTIFELNLGVERVKIVLQLLGVHQIYPSLAAACIGIVCGLPLTKVKIGLESLTPEEHMMQRLVGPNDSIILDDTQNCFPASLEAALDTLLQINAKRRFLVLGEMQTSGKFSEELHRKVAQKIYKEKFDYVFLGQGDARIIADELKNLGFWEERILVNLQNSHIVSRLLKILGKGDVCLVKGSPLVRLDEVVKRIAKKS